MCGSVRVIKENWKAEGKFETAVNYSATSNRASKGFALRTFPVLPDCQLCARQDNIPSVVPQCCSILLCLAFSQQCDSGYPRRSNGSFSCYCYLLCAVYSDCFISDIDCCVLITIVMCSTMWTDPFSYRQILCLCGNASTVITCL